MSKDKQTLATYETTKYARLKDKVRADMLKEEATKIAELYNEKTETEEELIAMAKRERDFAEAQQNLGEKKLSEEGKRNELQARVKLEKEAAELREQLQEKEFTRVAGLGAMMKAEDKKNDGSILGALRQNAREAIEKAGDKKVMKEISEISRERPPIREALAEHAHTSWATWEKYRARAIDLDNLQMWNRKAATPYQELTEQEKQSDRKIADEILGVLESYGFKL